MGAEATPGWLPEAFRLAEDLPAALDAAPPDERPEWWPEARDLVRQVPRSLAPIVWDGQGGRMLDYVGSKDTHRRHLTASQRAAVALDRSRVSPIASWTA